jgi:hypothetical protein
MSLVNRSRAVDAQKQEEPKSNLCAAHGCPMPGSISPTYPPSSWLCRFHYGAKADEWQAITRRVLALSQEERGTAMFLPNAEITGRASGPG